MILSPLASESLHPGPIFRLLSGLDRSATWELWENEEQTERLHRPGAPATLHIQEHKDAL